MRQGRYKRGSANGSSKLDEPMVKMIRESSDKGTVLAQMLGVSPAAICLIRKRRVWTHV